MPGCSSIYPTQQRIMTSSLKAHALDGGPSRSVMSASPLSPLLRELLIFIQTIFILKLAKQHITSAYQNSNCAFRIRYDVTKNWRHFMLLIAKTRTGNVTLCDLLFY